MSLKVMLAASESPVYEQLKFPLMASYKLDGVRAPIYAAKAMSRKMLAIENEFVQAWVAEHHHLMHGFDGELIVGKPYSAFEGDDVFNRTSGPVGKVSGEPDFSYWLFEDWVHGGVAMDRYLALRDRVANGKIPRVNLVEQHPVYEPSELKALMSKATGLGYEGLILKSPLGLYKNGRSTLNEGLLMKLKDWADSEALILSVNQGTTNTNELKTDELGHAKRSSAKAGKIPKDIVGSFTVKDVHSGVVFNCPPGSQTEEELKSWWAMRDQLEGRHLKYKYQKVGTLRKPRFPGTIALLPEGYMARHVGE